MNGRWLVVKVGCNECGNLSSIVGWFDTRDEAKAESDRLWDGDSSYAYPVFDTEDIDKGQEPWR